jgi:hypothetical protein
LFQADIEATLPTLKVIRRLEKMAERRLVRLVGARRAASPTDK